MHLLAGFINLFSSFPFFLFSLFLSLLSRAATSPMLIQVTLLSRLIPTVLALVHCLLQLRLLVLSRVMLCPPVPEIVAETHPSITLSFTTVYILVAASPLTRRTTYLCQQLLHAISVVILACKLLGNDHSQLLFPSLKL